MGPPSDGLTTHGRGQGGWGQGGWSDPRLLKLVLGTWNVTFLLGKEPELMREAERFQLDIVGLTLTHRNQSP